MAKRVHRIFYIELGYLPADKAKAYLDNIRETLKDSEESNMKTILIPVRDQKQVIPAQYIEFEVE